MWLLLKYKTGTLSDLQSIMGPFCMGDLLPCLPQVSSEALGLSLYNQPLRGQPIDMLPGFEPAALEVHVPAVAAPAQEAAPATAPSPRTPLRRTHTAGAICEIDPVPVTLAAEIS